MRMRCFHTALSFLWIALILAGHSLAADPVLPYTRTVVDMSGKTVKIPQVINRIVITCQGGASHEISVLGCADKIVAQPTMRSFPQLLKIYPRFRNIPDAGSFDVVNIEHIMTLKPDIVVASVTSMQGNKKIESLGIPVVTVSTGRADVDRLLNEFAMMGKILGKEKRAEALVQYWNDYLSLMQKRISKVSEVRKKKVFYTSSGSGFTVERELGWGHHFITASGGINVSKDLKFGGEVTPEQLLIWNPDVIIARNNKITRLSNSAVRDNPQLKQLRAVKANTVYQCPTGAFWWDRPSPEAILGIMWLAKTLYPEAMGDIDLKRETMSFYKIFYRYTLTDIEYDTFFSEAY